MSLSPWAWIPIVVAAAAAQTVRNAAQRQLTRSSGALPATLSRFLFGLPFALLALALVWATAPADAARPQARADYLAWIAFAAVCQLAATACLLVAMRERNFIVGVTWSKTDVLQSALFAALFLAEWPTALVVVAMLIATVGVVLLSRPPGPAAEPGSPRGRALWFGLASGALLALTAVGQRGAALTQPQVPAWWLGIWGVVWAQSIQSALLGSYLAWRDRAGLRALRADLRTSLLAGGMGALASAGWFTAFALRGAADVRTLGLVEVVFSLIVSRQLLAERLTRREWLGLALVVLGVGLVCMQL